MEAFQTYQSWLAVIYRRCVRKKETDGWGRASDMFVVLVGGLDGAEVSILQLLGVLHLSDAFFKVFDVSVLELDARPGL